MLGQRTLDPPDLRVVDRFRTGRDTGDERYLHDVSCHLLRMILTRHDFEDLEGLIAFCAQPSNLSTWLPSSSDRMVFSSRLTDGLRERASAAR